MNRKTPKKNRIKFTPKGDYVKKYHLSPQGEAATNSFGANIANPTVQPDGRTETGVAVPSDENIEQSKEYSEENKL
jgi:hypothetical protein